MQKQSLSPTAAGFAAIGVSGGWLLARTIKTNPVYARERAVGLAGPLSH